MLKKWKILESKEIFSSAFITLRQEKLERGDGKIIEPYYAIERPDVVYIIAVTGGKEAVTVYQYKNGIKDLVTELPAGFVDKDESPKDAAKRELLEETGYSAAEFISLGNFRSSLGLARNTDHFYLATHARKSADQSLDENEEIEVRNYPFDKLLKDIKEGKSFLAEAQSQLGIILSERYL